MKSDETAPSTLLTASERQFSNRAPPPPPPPPLPPPPPSSKAPKPSPKPTPKPKAPPQYLPLHQTKKKKHLSPPKHTLQEDKTKSSESTAKIGIAEATTPNQHQQNEFLLPLASTPRYTAISPATPPANIPRMTRPRTPAVTDDSIKNEPSKMKLPSHSQNPFASTSSQPETDGKLINKVENNISRIQKTQSKHASLIRRLGNQKWISILDILLAGFTLLFFTIAFYFIFHINPTLEMRLTTEFRAKVQTQIGKKSFAKCNHSSWIRTDNSTHPNIDDERCYTKHEYGRVFLETYKTATPNSVDGCNVDRVEIHPCYLPNSTNDPWNIFWGINDTTKILKNKYFCNGTELYDEKYRNWYAFQPPVKKYSLINQTEYYPILTNRTAPTQTFFFECPKCVFSHRIQYNIEDDDPEWKLFYQLNQTSYSIPRTNLQCEWIWGMPCNLGKVDLINLSERSFSHKTVPFKIIQDKGFCSS